MNKLVLLVSALGIGLIFYYFLSGKPSFNEEALKSIEAYKVQMLEMEESPVKSKDISKFSFFSPDESWSIEADFVPSAESQTFSLDMTDSTKTDAKLAGKATFIKNEKEISLLVFEEAENYLLPFRDASNGTETYGGGRYMNIPKDALLGGKITLNFNNAKNFYCAYNYNYICPIPPMQNLIPIPVNVGEKTYKL